MPESGDRPSKTGYCPKESTKKGRPGFPPRRPNKVRLNQKNKRYKGASPSLLEAGEDATDESLEVLFVIVGNLKNGIVRDAGLAGHVGSEGDAKDVHAEGMGHDSLADKGHARIGGSQAAKHGNLGASLKARSEKAGINALL